MDKEIIPRLNDVFNKSGHMMTAVNDQFGVFDKRLEEYAAKYVKPKIGAKRSCSIANTSVPNVLTRKRKRLNESLKNVTLNQTELENQTFDVIPEEDATFVITDANNNNEVPKRAVRKKNGNRDGTPLSSMLDESDSTDKGAKPKRLADITNKKKANDSIDDIDCTFKVPTLPSRLTQGSKSLIEKKLITFDDLNTDDESDNESNRNKRQQLFPKWSMNLKLNIDMLAKQTFVSFDVANTFFGSCPITVNDVEQLFPKAKPKDLERNDSSCWED